MFPGFQLGYANHHAATQIVTRIAVAVSALMCGHAYAAEASNTLPPGEQCQAAINAAEHAQHIPPHLVAAIGKVESGRRDPATGRWAPWPWTIDVGGQGAFFPTKQAAIDAVRTLQAQGVLSIDVGCLQINLSYHGAAFSNLQQAFDPTLNVAYGTQFLKVLFRQTGDWDSAVGRYHSMTAVLADDYRQRVLAAWSGSAIERPTSSPLQALARAWAATLDTSSAEPVRPIWRVSAIADDHNTRFGAHRRTALSSSRKQTTSIARVTRSSVRDSDHIGQRM